MGKVSRHELIARQSLPLELKIELSKETVRRWYEHWNGDVYVSFSGGMDSTILLHLVRSVYPDVVAVCAHGLLYPEIAEHVNNTPNIVIVRPRMNFYQIVRKYGYPVISKRNAQYIGEVQRTNSETLKRLRLTGIRKNWTFSRISKIPDKWQYLCDAPFNVSNRCCYFTKESPIDMKFPNSYPLIGIRTHESSQREQSYYEHGCNAINLKHPRSWPLAFWLDHDIWDYVRMFDVPYSSIYDMGYSRTGCFACMFGVHLEKEPNRFQRMQVTHPKLWKACVKWGIPEVLDYIGVSYDLPRQMSMFEVAASGKILYKDTI